MSADAPAATRRAGGGALAFPLRRATFVVLLVAAPLLPHISSDFFTFPAVEHSWVCIPLGALMLTALVDLRRPLRLVHLDLLALLMFAVALMCERPWRSWPVLLCYPALAYLAVRMLVIARVRARSGAAGPALGLRARLPRAWLLAGIAVLACVHVDWALTGTAASDVAKAGVQGAHRLLDGRPLYGAPRPGAPDPHLDTYGPADYEAYLPFAAFAGSQLASRLATLFFDLLTAGLLFLLGRQLRGPTAGTLLAFCWLAFPISLYEVALGFNDSIVAAAVVAVLLLARRPLGRGAAAAMAAWTKLSPLALIAPLAWHLPGPNGRGERALVLFSAAFAAATALMFLPVFSHDGLATVVSRTVGFQAHRPAGESLWGALQGVYSLDAPWLGQLSRVVHGLLAAAVVTLALLLVRIPRRDDVIGLAAACAGMLAALQLVLSYWSYSYVLWFAPLVLAVAVLGRRQGPPTSSSTSRDSDGAAARMPQGRFSWTGSSSTSSPARSQINTPAAMSHAFTVRSK
jgi:hypothetical protein